MLLAARIPTIYLRSIGETPHGACFQGSNRTIRRRGHRVPGKGGAENGKTEFTDPARFHQGGGGRRGRDGGRPDDLHPEAGPRRLEGAEDPRLVALRSPVRQGVVRRLRAEMGRGQRRQGHGGPHQPRRDPLPHGRRDLRRPGTRPDRVDRAPVAVRAERPRPWRRRQGGREALRETASSLPRKLLQPEHEEVLLLLPRLDDRPRLLPEEPLGEGRERERAGDVGGPDHVRREDQEGPGDPARHRPVPGARLEHGGPGAAVVVRHAASRTRRRTWS